MKRIGFALMSLISSVVGAQTLPSGGNVGEKVPAFNVRPGYKVTLAASGFGQARMIELDDKGTLYVTQSNSGKIVALRDKDGDGVYEDHSDFITGHKTVHGLFYHDGTLWFTESGAVFKTKIGDDGKAGEVQTVIRDGELPKGGGHWFRPILVVGDHFFTSIGDDGNISEATADPNVPHREDREKIWQFNLDGSGKTLWCSGIRNTEKLRLRPGTDELWGCDHGSDNYGNPYGEQKGDQPITDYNPPEEFNHYTQGGFYGHPFITGNRIPRLEFKDRKDIVELADKTIPPAWLGGAHWANNGWNFITKDYGDAKAGDAFICYHGSWNRTQKGGYCVQHIFFDKVTGLPYGAQTVVSCLEGDDPNKVLDRPVDVVQAPDGSLLFSTDQKNNIYRISHE